MNIIETQRHPLKFYVTLAFGFLFLLALGSFIIYIGLDNETIEKAENKHIIMPIFGSLICLLGFWMIYLYWKNSPKIAIDKNNLKIGNETFKLNNIKDVILTGKMPFRFIITFPMEGTAILFNDGRVKIFFDDMYINSYEIKSYLEQVILKKQEYKPISINKINNNDIRFERKETFIGNQFISLIGISLWGIIGFSIFMIYTKWITPPISLLTFFLIFSIFWFLIHSWGMHYFELTKQHLIVKNHNLIWKENIFLISDIKEIVFEAQGNQPNSMRIITKDFKTRSYLAGTLSDKTWLELKRKLELKEVYVRNESIYQ